MKIERATLKNTPEIAKLFDLYRQFYECEPDFELAKSYISERLKNNESVIFIALDKEKTIGFVQMYPSFCSVDAIRIFILYDLFVDADNRNSGVGALLMDKAAEYAKDKGASRVDLLTAVDNKPGQHLYEKLGYEKSLDGFYGYSLDV
jgi:ribosomal protein S18 acetylase RimI-like enzyme